MNNIFIFQTLYIPPSEEGDNQKTNQEINDCGSISMETDLKEYQRYLEVQYRKTNTQIRYLDSAKQLTRYIQRLDQDEIDRYLIHLNQHYKPNSISNHIHGMNKYLDYLNRSDLHRPIPDWKRITRDTISTDEIIQLRNYAKNNTDLQTYLFVLFITDNDCRNHEIIKARWDWIHGDRIFFNDCKTGDTIGRLSPELQTTLELWRTTRDTPMLGHEGFIFINTKGRYKGQALSIKGWKVRETIKELTKAVLGRPLTPQDLRASVITEEYNNYVNPMIIQRKARHRKQETTLRYNHVTDRMVDEYMASGNIFSKTTGSLLKPKQIIGLDKRAHINPFAPQDLTLIEGEDNTSCSFSFFFNKCLFRLTGITSFVNHVGGVPCTRERHKSVLSDVSCRFLFPYTISSRCIPPISPYFIPSQSHSIIHGEDETSIGGGVCGGGLL